MSDSTSCQKRREFSSTCDSKVILARPSRRSTTGTFYLWDFGFSMIFRSFCCMKEFGEGFDGVTFSTLIRIVAETAIVSFYTLPVGFPLPTIFKNSLYTLFCSLILDHGDLLKISNSVPKSLIFEFLVRYFFSP